MLDTIRICGPVQFSNRLFSIPGETEREREADGKEERRRRTNVCEREREKKSDEMQRLLAWLHCRLRELISGVQSAEKTPTYNLTPPLTFLLELLWLSQSLPSKHTLSSGGEVTFISSCAGDMELFFFLSCCCFSERVLSARVAVLLFFGVKLGCKKCNPCAKPVWNARKPKLINAVEVWDELEGGEGESYLHSLTHSLASVLGPAVRARLLNVEGLAEGLAQLMLLVPGCNRRRRSGT